MTEYGRHRMREVCGVVFPRPRPLPECAQRSKTKRWGRDWYTLKGVQKCGIDQKGPKMDE